eukprot:PhM_4_TR2397/c0_g1_i2/m.61203
MSRSVRQRAASVLQELTTPKHEDPNAAVGDDNNNKPPARTAEEEEAINMMSPMSKKRQQELDDLAKAAASRCLVYCRLRPTKRGELNDEDGSFMLLNLTKKAVKVHDDKTYEFDGTFGGDSQQGSVFDQVARPCLENALKGFRSALMCYGQTGTGKSFTMCNTKTGDEGIIPRSAIHIFSRIAEDTSRTYVVRGQFIQIYRDNLGDLMTESGVERVDIRFDADDGVTFPGCSEYTLESVEDFMKLYDEGNKRRVTTATAMNPESSRGHTALVVWISSKPASEDDVGGAELRGKVTFIDLAGYERFSKTGISNSNPIQKDEAKTINASLLSLGHVVSALSAGDKHIPWRNSKLTRLLQDSIGGRSRTTIILTVGPSSDHLHETTNTLQFGQRAMAVKVEAKVSSTVDFEKLATKLQTMLDERNEQINVLELQLTSKQAEREELEVRNARDLEAMRLRHKRELESLLAEGASTERLQHLLEQNEIEEENLREQIQEEMAYHEETYNRDTIALVDELNSQHKLKAGEFKVKAQEEILELRKRLAELSNGSEEDSYALKMAEKDDVLQERAREICALRETVEALQTQVKELGATPVEAEEYAAPATIVDGSLLVQIEERHDSEMNSKNSLLAELQRQVDSLTDALQTRNLELQDALQHINHLHHGSAEPTPQDAPLADGGGDPADSGTMIDNSSLSSNPVSTGTAPPSGMVPRLALGALVDRDVVDAERLRMLGEIASKDAFIASLQDQLNKASSSGQHHIVTPRTSRQATGRDMTAGAGSPRSADAAALRETMLELDKTRKQLVLREERCRQLAEQLRGGGKKDVPSDDAVDDCVGSTALASLMKSKDAEVSRLEALVKCRDEVIDTQAKEVRHLEGLVGTLRSAGASSSKKEITVPHKCDVAERVPTALVESYVDTAETLRDEVRRLQTALHQAVAGDGAASSMSALEELQNQLIVRDEEIAAAQRDQVIAFSRISVLQDAVLTLERQLADAGLEADLRDTHMDAMSFETDGQTETPEQRRVREELEARLREQEQETARVKNVIRSLSDQRRKDLAKMKELEEERSNLAQSQMSIAEAKASALADLEGQVDAYREKLKQLEGRETLDNVMLQKLQQQLQRTLEARNAAKAEHEDEVERLRREVQQSTQDLMAEQALRFRQQQQDEERERESGFFARMRAKLMK